MIVLGAGGHGKVVADAILSAGDTVLGFLDDDPDRNAVWDIPVLGPFGA
ncbi:MAG: acetyltransferase, partial [Dysosmobacter welbionis]